MTSTLSVSRAALLVMDVQNGIVERFGNDSALLGRLGGAIAAARQVGMPIIYVYSRASPPAG